ncbi:MAG: Crp/Fnr family transcriptional regulator [Gammaproteobacteria bacterium]|nr:Crp/Fnr family transcriptional regulator [Gammaproteobacteria bacterium]
MDSQLSPLHARMGTLGLLTPDDESLLDRLLHGVRHHPAGLQLQSEKAPYRATIVMLAGWGLRYKTLADGRRQITNFVLPGETIGLYGALFNRCDHAVELMTEATTAEIPCLDVMEVFAASPRLGTALCWIGGQDERFMEQQVMRIGKMNAAQRIAHMLLELHTRLLQNGFEDPWALQMPITQAVVADALGMSHVHANRSCRMLHEHGWVDSQGGQMTVREQDQLASFCDYDPDYVNGGKLPSKVLHRLAKYTSAASSKVH